MEKENKEKKTVTAKDDTKIFHHGDQVWKNRVLEPKEPVVVGNKIEDITPKKSR